MTNEQITQLMKEAGFNTRHFNAYSDEFQAFAQLLRNATLAEPVVEPTCKQPLQVHKQTGWVAHKNQYAVPVLFNPYTGEPRDVRDVQSDPQGVLIVPPGKVDMIAASPPPPAEPESGVCQTCISLSRAVMLDQTGSA